MIVDTSALVAVSYREAGHEALLDAMLKEQSIIPAPVLVEYRIVTSGDGNAMDDDASRLLEEILARNASIVSFSPADADAACGAIERYGRGNGRGGRLNLLDLMVYGMAKRTGRPILCTGRDFASTDIAIHPSSRSF